MRTGEWVVQVQVEYAEYLWSWKLRTGDLCSITLVRGVAGELEDENGDLVVQL